MTAIAAPERRLSKVDRILIALEAAAKPVRASEVAAELALDTSVVSVRLGALVAIGLAKREADPARQVRARLYTITDAGRMRAVCNAGRSVA